MSKPNPKVDGFLRKAVKWKEELRELRRILLECGLNEEVKWRHPCYTHEENNVVILGGFKDSCVMNFVKGSLLTDPRGILVKPGENSRASRFVRFTSVRAIIDIEPILKKYISEAVALEKAGLKVDFKRSAAVPVPDELQNKFDEVPAAKTAFDALTPGRQRAYLLYFSGAKQSKTRTLRVDRCLPQILQGKGLDA